MSLADSLPDWLRRARQAEPAIEVGDRRLPIAIRRLPHARRMTLRLAPDGSEVRVSIPRACRTAEAIAFVHKQADWLTRQVEGLPRTAPPQPGGTMPYRGALLSIAHDPAAPRKPELAGEAIRIGGPETMLAQRLRRWLEGEAVRLMTDDLARYCARAGQPVPKLALSNAQRRWGSCAVDGAIRMNWRLVMAPDAVRQAVVAHEVTHLVHFDHSPRFHAMLADLFEGSVDDANRWLKRHGRGLYAHFG